MKRKNIITGIVVMVMLLTMSMSAMAASDVVVYLPENQVWSISYSDTRSGAYSTATVHCDSVYPIKGSDNFKKMQARLVDSSGTLISAEPYIILEENGLYDILHVDEGYLHLKTIYFQFRGNSKEAANAVVDYFAF